MVLDNLKEGVIKPDLYEPELNPVYREVLAHYGVVADPARIRDPNRKGTVENAIQHTQSTALKGRRFEIIEEQNAFLEQWEPFLDTFSLILQDELDRRPSRLMDRRFQQSGLDERVTLADFDWRFNPKLPRAACFELHTLKFVAEGNNAIIIGKPGTGKSHVAKAVAYQATLQDHKVRYLEADSAFGQYALGDAAEQRQQMRTLLEADLLVLDDLFLARRISDAGGELLQLLVHQRYKLRRSIVVTSNRVVQDWGKYLGDNTMATTILDRLMHRAHMLEFEGKSYRLEEAASRLTGLVKQGESKIDPTMGD